MIESDDHIIKNPATSTLVYVRVTGIFVRMDSTTQDKHNLDCFNQFIKSPKGVSMEVMKNAHKFVARTLQSGELSPTVQDLVKICSHFTQGKIKTYIFTRMGKRILLELVLCIIQEIVLNGLGRAETICLEVEKTKYGGKKVKIVDPFLGEKGLEEDEMFQQIDEAYFRLVDSDGKSPDVKLAMGKGHKEPYSPFADNGAFVRPKPSAVRSLEDPIEVIQFSLLFLVLWALVYFLWLLS